MDIKRYTEALEARRRALTVHLSDVEQSLDETPPRDWEDRASERQGDEVLETLGNAELAELRQIDAALERVAAGTFGACQTCGEMISEARLELLPATPFCKNCAR